MNVVVLIGRCTRDIELRTTTTGKQVATFSLAVNKAFKPTDGSPDVDFFNIVAWAGQAEYAANYLGKGRLVAVEGRLQARKYTASDGSNREVVEIVANNVQGLDRPRDDAERPARQEPNPTNVPPVDEYGPFADE